MTTYQDPPQSRRAVRQSERTESDEQAQPTPQHFPDMWDTVSRRAAQLPTVPRQDDAHQGRRANTPQQPLGEPLIYTTQSKAPVPINQAPSIRNRSIAGDAQPFASTSTQQPGSEQPAFRPRDFSPEGRRAAPSSETSWSLEPDAPASDLDYHTAARADLQLPAAPIAPVSQVPPFAEPIAPAVVEPAPFELSPASPGLPIEHTLTRRELRAMQQAEEAALNGEATVAYVAPEPVYIPPVAAPPAVIAETPFERMLRQTAPDAAPAALIEPPVHYVPPAAPAPADSAADLIAQFEALTVSQQNASAPTIVPAPPAAPVAPPVVEDEVPEWSPPVGHWSTQVDLDDDFIETTINRRIGSGSTQTNALVLPSIPQGADIRGPLTGTGEIMLTGSIDLPRSLGSTGASDRFDQGGIDALFDLNDAEVTSTDSSPVRAIRAVSTHTSGHGVTHTQKPKGTRALTALLIAASAMAVVVAGLLVAAFAFNVF